MSHVDKQVVEAYAAQAAVYAHGIDLATIGPKAMEAFDRWRVQRTRDKRILAALELPVKDRSAEQAALVAVARLIGSGFCT